MREEDRPRADPRERLTSSSISFPAMHEPCIDAERNVVQEEPLVRSAHVDTALQAVGECAQRSDRIVTVESQISGEMVTGSKRNADEGGAAFERDAGDGRQRAIAAGHAQNVGRRGTGQLRRFLAFPQDMGLDAEGLRLRGQLARSGRIVAGTRIDEETRGQGTARLVGLRSPRMSHSAHGVVRPPCRYLEP
jgi:hypothetical protein